MACGLEERFVTHAPLAVCQSWIMWSSPPETSLLPSVLQARDQTGPVWAGQLWVALQLAEADHVRIVPPWSPEKRVWPLPAMVISTTSVLVAARNFQSAWLMRLLGEPVYRAWHVDRIQEVPLVLYLFCLAGNTLLTAGVGGALMWFGGDRLIPVAIGMGLVAYAAAVVFYTLLSVWRLRRSSRKI